MVIDFGSNVAHFLLTQKYLSLLLSSACSELSIRTLLNVAHKETVDSGISVKELNWCQYSRRSFGGTINLSVNVAISRLMSNVFATVKP